MFCSSEAVSMSRTLRFMMYKVPCTPYKHQLISGKVQIDRNICCLGQSRSGTCRVTLSFLFRGCCQMQQTINRAAWLPRATGGHNTLCFAATQGLSGAMLTSAPLESAGSRLLCRSSSPGTRRISWQRTWLSEELRLQRESCGETGERAILQTFRSFC